jgi:hypothetical protein
MTEEADKVRLLCAACCLVITANFICIVYASVHARGLYADAGPLLVVIFESKRLFVSLSGSRAVVEILRQAPVVLLSNLSSATLFQCGQVLTLVMLALPTVFCALCWPIAPRDHKAWILFPIAFLLVGFAATSFHAVGEAAIAASYFWILLFLLLFRVRSIREQALFLLLCIPAFWLHEGAFLLTMIILLALILRVHAAARTAHERLFIGLAYVLLTMILASQIYHVIYPNYPDDRAHILYGLTHFEFVFKDGRFNLPLITGALAPLALISIAGFRATLSADRTGHATKFVLAVWLLVVLAAIMVATTVETSLAPLAQAQARYHPIFASAALGLVMILLRRFQLPDRIWNNAATVFVLLSLCAAQAVTDVQSTRQWKAYTTDLQTTLGREHGLIPWETRLNVANHYAAIDWSAFEIAWTIPYMCIIFAPNGVVTSMIDLPRDLTFRPLDPERPERLPKLDGIDFAPYKRYLAEQKIRTSR